MTHEEAFIRTICESPDDDSLRLIFADWLEEQGSPRGEFIRVQCALAKIVCHYCRPDYPCRAGGACLKAALRNQPILFALRTVTCRARKSADQDEECGHVNIVDDMESAGCWHGCGWCRRCGAQIDVTTGEECFLDAETSEPLTMEE